MMTITHRLFALCLLSFSLPLSPFISIAKARPASNNSELAVINKLRNLYKKSVSQGDQSTWKALYREAKIFQPKTFESYYYLAISIIQTSSSSPAFQPSKEYLDVLTKILYSSEPKTIKELDYPARSAAGGPGE